MHFRCFAITVHRHYYDVDVVVANTNKYWYNDVYSSSKKNTHTHTHTIHVPIRITHVRTYILMHECVMRACLNIIICVYKRLKYNTRWFQRPSQSSGLHYTIIVIIILVGLTVDLRDTSYTVVNLFDWSYKNRGRSLCTFMCAYMRACVRTFVVAFYTNNNPITLLLTDGYRNVFWQNSVEPDNLFKYVRVVPGPTTGILYCMSAVPLYGRGSPLLSAIRIHHTHVTSRRFDPPRVTIAHCAPFLRCRYRFHSSLHAQLLLLLLLNSPRPLRWPRSRVGSMYCAAVVLLLLLLFSFWASATFYVSCEVYYGEHGLKQTNTWPRDAWAVLDHPIIC
jgi:hypothetical protein